MAHGMRGVFQSNAHPILRSQDDRSLASTDYAAVKALARSRTVVDVLWDGTLSTGGSVFRPLSPVLVHPST